MNTKLNALGLEILKLSANSYASIPETEWEKIYSCIRTLNLKKNEYLIKTDEVPDKLAFIINGIFRVYYTTEKGDEKTLIFRTERDFLSAYSSFLENARSRYSIQAVTDSILLYISFADYQKLANSHPCWQNLSGRYAERLFLEKEKRESELLTLDATQRYVRFMNDFSKIANKIPNYMIASYLGITPVAMSRIINRSSK